MLPSFAIEGKTYVEACSKKVAQDYDLLWVFGCLTYYHVKKDKLDLRARKNVFGGFKKGIKAKKIGIRRTESSS